MREKIGHASARGDGACSFMDTAMDNSMGMSMGTSMDNVKGMAMGMSRRTETDEDA